MLLVTWLKMEQELAETLGTLGVEGSLSAASALSKDAKDYSNNAMIEQLWAMKAIKYAETHMKLLGARDAKELKLTKYDDEMFCTVQQQFSHIDVKCIDADLMKSDESKAKWRIFCNHYQGLIQDFNFATLLRLDSSKDYSEENTIIVPRVQFLAIEVTRNRQSMNSCHYQS